MKIVTKTNGETILGVTIVIFKKTEVEIWQEFKNSPIILKFSEIRTIS